tara:strand:- start:222 stop:803 length:582 start_codon:yes stop_codon:yes gene_type:complete
LQVGSVLAAAGRFSGDVHNLRRSSFDREGGVLGLSLSDSRTDLKQGLPIGNFLRSVQSGASRAVRHATRGHSRSKDGAPVRLPEEVSEAEAAEAAAAADRASATASVDAMQARINSIRGTTVRRIKHVQGFLREKGTAPASGAAAGQAAGGNQRTGPREAGSFSRRGSMNFFKQAWPRTMSWAITMSHYYGIG